MIQLPWASSSVFVCSASSGVSVVFKERYRSQYLQSHWRMLRDVESGEDARQIVETFSPETFLKGRKGCFVRVSVFVACITQIWSAPRSRSFGPGMAATLCWGMGKRICRRLARMGWGKKRKKHVSAYRPYPSRPETPLHSIALLIFAQHDVGRSWSCDLKTKGNANTEISVALQKPAARSQPGKLAHDPSQNPLLHRTTAGSNAATLAVQGRRNHLWASNVESEQKKLTNHVHFNV